MSVDKGKSPASSPSQSHRISDPFANPASTPSSPTPLQPATADTNRWQSPYRPADAPTPSTPSSIETTSKRQSPPPPLAPVRHSQQSARRQPRAISNLPPIPRQSDPEKADAAEIRWGSYEDDFTNELTHEDPVEVNKKCLRLLIYLSGPVFFISLLLAIWSLIALFLALLLIPINLLRKSKSLSEQIVAFLAPPLRIHLSCILARLRDDTYSSYSLGLLILVTLLSPVVSIIVAISAWTAACFWFYAAIIGDPEGADTAARRNSYLKEQNEDGKASVLGVRRWWKRWLTRALR